MNAVDFVFPRPQALEIGRGQVRLPRGYALEGAVQPEWLVRRLAKACRAAGVRLDPQGEGRIALRLAAGDFPEARQAGTTDQAYSLEVTIHGNLYIESPGVQGLRHGLVTLCLMLEAVGAKATLTPVVIRDWPAFRVRGVQLDLARDFFPPMTWLKKAVDRIADLKLNTLWLYVENHFRAPGLEDISQKRGITPAQAREISTYAAARGVDVVPATNLLSHMEGWFRLERYSDFCDGRGRSYAIPTRPEVWRLVKKYATELARAFPSRNFHAGFDEYLFTGTNPEAKRIIERHGKAVLYGRFAARVMRHLESLGKTVWFWDDMLLGKNVARDIGFKEGAPKALRLLPKSAIPVHWWYSTDEGGLHAPILERVKRCRRPFAVAPSTTCYRWTFGHLPSAAANQEYLARAGREAGAFGYVCTQWEAQYGSSVEAGWPLLAMSAGFAWSGGERADEDFYRAMSFTVTGDTDGALADYLRTIAALEQAQGWTTARDFRAGLLFYGPYYLWRKFGPVLEPRQRRAMRRLLARAQRQYERIGNRDASLKRALRLGIVFFREGLGIIEAFDSAWGEYHRAALIERDSGRRLEYRSRVEKCVSHIREAVSCADRIRAVLRHLQRTGHTPYDDYALRRHMSALRAVIPLIRAAVAENNGLPYFERLFYLPDAYHISNIHQIRYQNFFFERHPGLPWPARRR